MSNFCNFIPHPQTGEMVTPSAKEGFGVCRVDQETTTINNNFISKRKRVAFLRGRIEDLNSLVSQKRIQGKIIRVTSESPFYEGQDPVSNPDTGEVTINLNGNQYYQEFRFTQDLNAYDHEKKMVSVVETTANVED